MTTKHHITIPDLKEQQVCGAIGRSEPFMRSGMRFGILWRSLLLMLLLPLAAHTQDTYADRVILAGAFNNALAQLWVPGITSVSMGNAHTGIIRIRDPRTGELLINESAGAPEIQLVREGTTHFRLIVTLRPAGGLIDIQPSSHEMVCDLQDSWLRRSWGLEFTGKVGTYVFGSGTTCADPQGEIAQPYFMSAVAGLNSNAGLRNALAGQGVADFGLGLKRYVVPTSINSASEVLTPADPNAPGATYLIQFAAATAGTDRFLHIAKKVDYTAPARDSAIAKLAFTHAKFNVPAGIAPATGPVVTEVKLEAHTHAYASDCSPSLPDGPDAGAAYVRLSYRADRRDGSGLQWYHCEQRWQTSNPDADNAALWNFFDKAGTSWQNINNWGEFNIDTEGYLYFDAKCENPVRRYRIMQIRSRAIPAQTCELVLPGNGTFSVDEMTGELVYRECPLCPATPVLCFPFTKQLSGSVAVNNVVAASAQTFSNEWSNSPQEFLRGKVLNTWPVENTSNNDYETGKRAWRPKEAFAYRTGAKSSAGPADRVYDNAGAFLNDQGGITNSLSLFNWKNPDANTGTKWIGAGAAMMYSPLGESVEERDVLGIYNAAKFAHQFTMPKLVAKNAQYISVGFESFEDGAGNDNAVAHSGKNSYKLSSQGAESPVIIALTTTEQLRSQKLLVQFWVKRTYTNAVEPQPAAAQMTTPFAAMVVDKIAQTGEWTLYQAVCDLSANAVGAPIELKFVRNVNDDVWIDDVRAQPYDAEMTCFVYDPATLRVITQFDDQHFGLYFQYNGEGKLVRKMRETERGMKTVSEAQYHTPQHMYRDGTQASMAAFSGPDSPASAAMMRGDANGDGVTDPLANGRVNLLDIDAGPDGVKVKAFEGNGRLVDDIKALLTLDTTRLNEIQRAQLGALGIADAERLRLAMRAAELEQRVSEAEAQVGSTSDAAAREELKRTIETLRAERDGIVRERLGMSEEEFRTLCRNVRKMQEDASEEGTNR